LADDGVLLIHGVEISTMYGDFIVFSPDLDYLSTFKDVQGLPPEASIPDDAAVVWVHAGAGGGRSGSAYYPTLERHVAPIIDAVEIYNGNWLADRYVKTAERIAGELGLARTGGSDAHEATAIMACATEFPDPVRSTADVVKALKEHRTSPWRRETKSRRRLGLFG
jgi:predicted metal-dependent phosphoesterase TrpH